MIRLAAMCLCCVVAFLVLGCSGAATNEGADEGEAPQDMTLQEYADECVTRIGEIPPIDSRLGVVIPITVGGQVPAEYEPHMDCDCPSLLPHLGCDGQCVPFSRLQLLRDDAEGQMVAMFRRTIVRPEDSNLFDEVDVIVHSVRTGETGWFQAKADNPTCDPSIGLDGHGVPLPSVDGADAFWRAPSEVVPENCGGCHDNDPFYYSPYVGQVASHLPADPLGKYTNSIGPFAAWPEPMSLSTRGNTCVGCHRIGIHHTSQEGLLTSIGAAPIAQGTELTSQYPGSHWMPAHNFLTEAQWNVVYEESANLLYEWHAAPGAHDYTITPIPSGPTD